MAADGVHSRLRGVLFPDRPRPVYAGYVTWRGVVPTDAARSVDVPPVITETWGRGRRFGIVPLGDGRVYWFASESLAEGRHADDTLAEVAARYRGWHRPIPELLEATAPETLLRHDILHLEQPLDRYVDGRVALVGDAAHAMTPDLGQGACQAIEDAVILAAVTRDDAADVAGALAAYDQQRRSRTQSLVRASARVGKFAQARHPLLAGLRDLLVGLTPLGIYLRVSEDTLAWTPPVS